MSRGHTLHQVLSADPTALADCFGVISPGDELLLADEGVQWLAKPDELYRSLAELDFTVVLNVLETDIAARGLGYTTALNEPSLLGDLLGDIQWVEKVCQFQRVLSWK